MKMSITRVDPLSIEIPKKPPHKSASEHRRATKPIMEKRRRARINHSLDQIKALVLVGLNKDPAKHTKLEKADILEMAVEYLKDLVQVKSIDKLSAMKNFVAGIDACASEVKKHVNGSSDVELAMKRRIVSSLKNNFSSLTIANGLNPNNLVSSTTSSSSSSSTGPSSPITLSPLNMKTEPISPAAINRDALTTISFNYNNSSSHNSPKSQSQLTPPPSANSSNESFRFSPVHFTHSLHPLQSYHLQSNFINSPVSPSSQYDDGMDCSPVDCSKSSKLHLDDNVWRPW